MASVGPAALHRDLDLIAGSGSVVGLGDAELLGRFAAGRGEASAAAAFEAIVARHGPMVLAACRRALREPGDADDAFQAVFLVLAEKAGSVRVADSLAPWLYGVARRVTVRARADGRKRRGREATGVDLDAEAPATTTADDGMVDVRPILDEELARLPEKYRSPVVLCHLEGVSHEEAARRLGWPVGTVGGRLSRARDLLRSRLARRGLGASTAAVLASMAPREASAVPPALRDLTVRSATGFVGGGAVPVAVSKLTRGVITAMLVHKVRAVGVVALAVTGLTLGVGYVAGQVPGGGADPAARVSPPAPPPEREVVGSAGQDKAAPTAPANADRSMPSPIRGIGGGMAKMDPLDLAQQRKATELFLPRPGMPRTAGTDLILAVAALDGRSIRAMNLGSGRWDEYTIPEGVRAIPSVMTNGVLSLAYTGPEVREIAVYDAKVLRQPHSYSGAWMKKTLHEPAKGDVVPVLAEGIFLYQVGNRYYAYSDPRERWDDLLLPGPEPAGVRVEKNAILIQQGPKTYVFSAKVGYWMGDVAARPPAAPPRPDERK